MGSSGDYRRNRLLGLLAERAVFGLSGFKQQELGRLLTEFPDVDCDCMDRVAAEVMLAGTAAGFEPLPPWVRQALCRAASAYRYEAASRPRGCGKSAGNSSGQLDKG